jgi:SAM-dependent methyltransferase
MREQLLERAHKLNGPFGDRRRLVRSAAQAADWTNICRRGGMEETLSRALARETERDPRASAGAMSSLLETVPCDICGSTQSQQLFSKRETRTWWIAKCTDDARLDRDHAFAIVRCSDCGHVYVNPRMQRAISDDIYARYWRNLEPPKVRSSDYARYVCRQLAALHPRGELLDFGCGWGSVLAAAGLEGWRATGVEVDERKVAFCREQGLTAIYGDLLDQPFPAETFDAAIAEQVFEHLYTPVAYMKEVQRVLKPGGVFYVAVPNFGGIAAKLKGAHWDLVHPVSHVRYFDRRSLADMARRCGFEVLRPDYVARGKSALGNVGHAAKTFLERTLSYYPLGLALYLRKR